MPDRVLIIDDERAIAQALTIRLQVAGHDVRSAYDGPSGLAAAGEVRPDVIVLDIRMPGMDGYEVNRHLKANPDLRDIPVIFLSANVQESARQTAMAAGAYAFIIKPYEAKDVIATIRGALNMCHKTTDCAHKGDGA